MPLAGGIFHGSSEDQQEEPKILAILWDLGEDMLGTGLAGPCKRTAKEGSQHH